MSPFTGLALQKSRLGVLLDHFAAAKDPRDVRRIAHPLNRYTTDGRLEMSNNAAERAMRPLVLGRKVR